MLSFCYKRYMYIYIFNITVVLNLRMQGSGILNIILPYRKRPNERLVTCLNRNSYSIFYSIENLECIKSLKTYKIFFFAWHTISYKNSHKIAIIVLKFTDNDKWACPLQRFLHCNQHPGGYNQELVSSLWLDTLDNFNPKGPSQNLLQSTGYSKLCDYNQC